MEKGNAPADFRKNLRAALFKCLLLPVLTLAFFIAAPHWLNQKLHAQIDEALNTNPNLTPDERSARLDKFAALDFQKICLDRPPEYELFNAQLRKSGVVARFERLRWGLWLSLLLVIILGAATGAIFRLNRQAARSQSGLIQSYRQGWKIAMAVAVIEVFLLVPLLTYGIFEFSVLSTGHYLPQLLFIIALGGVFALWRCAGILLRNIPLEFKEPMAREVTPAEAPELWQAVRYAAVRLHTAPPDRIVIGLKLNFYVTELAVDIHGGRAEGRTLFLSLPLLKQLSEAEILAIIGHELGHFIGEDTKLTREFYPMRLKAQTMTLAMARAKWVGRPSCQFLYFFGGCFAETERTASRRRELLADSKAAALTSPQTAGRALVRFQVAVEAFQRGLKDSVKNQGPSPLEVPLQPIVLEKLAVEPAFWTQLFEKKLPHPLDTHPPLEIRLRALGLNIGAPEAQAIALDATDTAWQKWLAPHEHLFASLNQQAAAALSKMQARAAIVGADYQTKAGRELLDRHFPEQKWRVRPGFNWVIVILLGLFAFCLLMLLFSPVDAGAKVIFAALDVVLGMAMAVVRQRNRGVELSLRAEGLTHTNWRRPLLFRDVKQLAARRVNSNILLTFHFKEKQPPLWKFRLWPFPVRRMALPMTGLEGKPAANAETILRYFARQTAP